MISRLSKLDAQQCITLYCNNPACRRHSAGEGLNIVATIARHGDLPLVGLGQRFRYSLCGHRPAESRLGWVLPPAAAQGWGDSDTVSPGNDLNPPRDRKH